MRKLRESRIEIIKRQLLSRGLPRFQMFVMIFLTGLSGFLFSFTLLKIGVERMWVRYPIAIFAAYCVFLILLRLWLWWQNRQPDLNFDLPNIDFGSGNVSSANNFQFGGGGDFSGGGAGGNWAGADVSSSVSVGTDSLFDSVSFDLEELGLIILVLVALIGGLLAALYVVYIAPVLLAEIFVDGVLLAGLYKSVKNIEQKHWLRTAVNKTLIPAILATVLFTIAGFAMQKAIPEANSIGKFYRLLLK